MKISRVVGYLTENYNPPGGMIEKDFIPDTIIIQRKSAEVRFGSSKSPDIVQKGWELTAKKICRLTVEGKAKVVTRRTVDGERSFVENAKEAYVDDAYEGKLNFTVNDSTKILGLGQHEDGIVNYRDVTQHLYQNNMQIPMPVFITTDHIGILLDAECLMVYEEAENVIQITLDAVNQIDYYVIEGENLAEIIRGIRRITGKAAMLPLWAYGYVQSRERYKTQEEILQIAAEFEQRQIPVSCLVLDWMSWEEGKWGNKRVDKSRFPNLKELTHQLHQKGIAFMVSVWPNMSKSCEDNQEMLDAGKLYANLSTYDAFDQEARAIYWRQCERELYSGGTDAWWCDSTEPFTPDWNGTQLKSAEERYQLARESLAKQLDARQANAFALMHAKGMYEHQTAIDQEKRVVNLTRSGYPSIQKYGAILWSGDIMATWQVFRRQIVEGIQMCSSGIPYWTLDIGAFFAGNRDAWRRWNNSQDGTQPWFWNGDFEDGVADQGYRELYVRWLQYGTFLPIMRSHGTDTPREPWYFGEPGDIYYDTIVKYIRLRYRLIPYIYSLAWQVHQEDALMMRSLLTDYPADPMLHKNDELIAREYLFGDFLVCPVTEAFGYGPRNERLDRADEWSVYLPLGNGWYDYETKEYYSGNTEFTAKAPLSKMPLYIRSGSIVPVDPAADHNLYQIRRQEEVTVEIYGGEDGSLTYYLDQGNGYGFMEQDYVQIGLQWKESEKQFLISAAEGNYPYPSKWHLVYYSPLRGRGERTIIYGGMDVLVDFC